MLVDSHCVTMQVAQLDERLMKFAALYAAYFALTCGSPQVAELTVVNSAVWNLALDLDFRRLHNIVN